MIEKAFVSGQIARSIFKEEEKLFIINAVDTETVLNCTPYEKSLFFNSGAEIKTFENITAAELREKLIKEKSFFDALYAAIHGFDPDLSEETRILSIQRAESLVKNPEILDFVKSRLFSNIVPGHAALQQALDLSQQNNCRDMTFLYGELLNGKEVIAYILSAFEEEIYGLSLEKDFVKIKNTFITTGLFAKLFLHTTNKNVKGLNQLVFEPGIDTKIKEEIPLISKILTRMKGRLKKKCKLRVRRIIFPEQFTFIKILAAFFIMPIILFLFFPIFIITLPFKWLNLLITDVYESALTTNLKNKKF